MSGENANIQKISSGTSATSIGSMMGVQSEKDFSSSSNQKGTEIETMRITGSASYTSSETDASHQHKQFSTNLAMYVSTNTSMKEMSLNYAHNTNISEHGTDSISHLSGLQRKIVKSNNQYNILSSYTKPPKAEQMGKIIIKSNAVNEITEEKTKKGLQHSNSSSSLDFLAEGERMVSELCNISSEQQQTAEIPSQEIQKIRAKCSCHNKNNVELFSAETSSSPAIYDDSVPIQIIQLAVEACTVAENIAIANKNRPCFKNIQTICEKTRSNVQKPDSAVANLHSQGVPWVIKNFIFSFVRILDGWKGIKELLCEKHESFKRIENKYYNPQIRDSFVEWQIATKNMLNHIYKTFKALDSGFQAEQQRYKQNANEINFSTLQNQKPLKQTAPVPAAIQQSYNVPLNQWGTGGVYGPSAPFFAPGMPVCGNVFPQWTHPPAVPNVSQMQTAFNDPLSRNDCDANRLAMKNEIQETKDTNNTQKNAGSWLHRHNKHFVLKYQQTPSLLGSNESQKTSIVEPAPVIPENIFNRNEIRETFPINNTNYWTNEHNKNPNACIKDLKFNENETFSNRNTFPPTQNKVFGNNVNSTCNFESDSEIIDITKVYMKPGSYSVPIKQCESLSDSDFGTVETMTVHNSLLAKGTTPTVLNMPFSKTPNPSFPQPLFDCNSYNIFKQKQSIENIPSVGSAYMTAVGFNKAIPKLNEGYLTCSDKEWEVAKQMAPKILTSMYSTSDTKKTNAQRLYEALTTNGLNHNTLKCSDETQEILCADSISWNKVSQEFFGENTQQLKRILDNVNNVGSDKSINAESITLNFEGINSSLEKISGQDLFCKDVSGDVPCANNLFTSEPNKSGTFQSTSNVSISGETSYIEREYALCDTVKKLKKKSNNVTKCTNRKNNENSLCSGMKRMENILLALWNIDKKMDNEFGLDVNKAPHFFEVVKNPLTLSDISDRIQNSFYTDVHQVAHDIRSVFYEAYEYLKVYPDEKLRTQVDEMCATFEKLFSEDFATFKDKNRKQKKRSEFFDEKKVNMFSRDGKKVLEKEKFQT